MKVGFVIQAAVALYLLLSPAQVGSYRPVRLFGSARGQLGFSVVLTQK